jgi:hypothetical protein
MITSLTIPILRPTLLFSILKLDYLLDGSDTYVQHHLVSLDGPAGKGRRRLCYIEMQCRTILSITIVRQDKAYQTGTFYTVVLFHDFDFLNRFNF